MKSANTSAGLTIWQTLADHAARTPDAVAILGPNQAALTYKRLYSHIQETVLTLQAFCVGRADRVAIVLPNGPEMALAFLGVAAGATAAPLNPGYRAEVFEFCLDDIEAKALIVRAGIDSPARAVARAHGIPILELSPSLNGAGLFPSIGEPRVSSTQAEFARPDDIALVLHTSGTTSRPKLVPLTHANLYQSAHNIQTTLVITPGDRCINVMPPCFISTAWLAHCFLRWRLEPV